MSCRKASNGGVGVPERVSSQNNSAIVSTRVLHAFRAALAEAARFVGQTAPNPAVGCALLDEHDEIVLVAAHHRAGELHAERLALQQAREAGVIERVRTAVVTLEPCNHTGRTPPCTEALLDSPVETVWIGCRDPNPRVDGSGAARLAQAGLTVLWLAEAGGATEVFARCQALLAPFACKQIHRRPWITVKQALNAQGSMVPPAGQTTFTSSASLTFAHRIRRMTDGILTGTGTILADLPSFTVRHVPDHEHVRRLLVICGQQDALPQSWLDQRRACFDIRFCSDLTHLPALLAQTSAMWLMAEAGPRLLAALRQNNLWDDWLTIRQGAEAQDQYFISQRQNVTPLALLPEWVHCQQEQVCFPES
ncbi:bifunctional diaminohydroxyphosphoribosylaminopyrimidine deaminase/5-amino-6-(5-phosphoribosylamino)uracil reductase RibD [Acetobacter thailandicus]|uniref:bifunctional diaminohydroxyphosphoribosylaminopyrimidine deaminase/5-amino-6-(5-phosphoribosylamino)uracil reductase RibD n=1 Tax=Acetobacter thailandicus TaxID=1502842 RepID=UPI001BA9D81F|nr:bifunctional diaminohydroxyphosphoribosylaminopyrimidine deaminase/5-amino-6-(5-phosphoribosylamino)uracil reductase RibD [Acetobacter thailandicus]